MSTFDYGQIPCRSYEKLLQPEPVSPPATVYLSPSAVMVKFEITYTHQPATVSPNKCSTTCIFLFEDPTVAQDPEIVLSPSQLFRLYSALTEHLVSGFSFPLSIWFNIMSNLNHPSTAD
jgi:hypothetical protein